MESFAHRVFRSAGRARMRVAFARSALGAALLALCCASPSHAVSVTGCEGDCGGDDAVTVDELLTGVAISLDRRPVGDCAALDLDGDGGVIVDELIKAV